MNSGREQFRKFRSLIEGARRIIGKLPRFWLKPFCHLPGKIGVLGRYIFASRTFSSIGEAVYIGPHCIIKNAEYLSVGDRVSIHEFCYLDALGGIRIGNDVAIAHGCSVLSTNHSWDDLDNPIKYNPVKFGPVEICDDVWIGCGVRILAGSKISERVVVAAGSVVRGELESGYVYGGIPAKKLKPL